MFYISLFLYHKTLRCTGASVQKALMEHIVFLGSQGGEPSHKVLPFPVALRMARISAKGQNPAFFKKA